MPTETLGALSIPAFCQTYGVGRTRAYEMIGAGIVEAKKFGASTLIDRASAEAWYHSLPAYGAPPPRIAKMRARIAAMNAP
jgi:hypothetical protein